MSITSCTLGTVNPSVYYVVGTAFVFMNEKEPSKGRILVFQVQSGMLQKLLLINLSVRDLKLCDNNLGYSFVGVVDTQLSTLKILRM